MSEDLDRILKAIAALKRERPFLKVGQIISIALPLGADIFDVDDAVLAKALELSYKPK